MVWNWRGDTSEDKVISPPQTCRDCRRVLSGKAYPIQEKAPNGVGFLTRYLCKQCAIKRAIQRVRDTEKVYNEARTSYEGAIKELNDITLPPSKLLSSYMGTRCFYCGCTYEKEPKSDWKDKGFCSEGCMIEYEAMKKLDEENRYGST